MRPLLLLLLAALAPTVALAAPRDPDHRPTCHTPEMLRHRFEEEGGPAYSGPNMTRPAEAGYVDSTIYPLRIHYRNADDADRAATVVLPIAEDVWHTEIEVMGWPQPPTDYGVGGSDSYDIYLTNDQTQGGAYTYTTYDSGIEPDTNPNDNFFSNSSWIAVDDDQSWIPDSLMSLFVSHEFNHACQYAIDANESTVFVWESTAEAISEIYSGLSSDYTSEIPSFQSHPNLSILFSAYDRQVSTYGNETGYYEYGGWIFGAFIEQAFGANDGTELLQMWTDLATGSKSDEPDFVDALGLIGGADFPDAGQLFLDFSEWRLMVAKFDDGAHYSDAAHWGKSSEVGLEGTLTLSAVDGTALTPVNPPYYLGDSVWEIDVDAASTGTLHLDVTGDSTTQWGIVAAGYPASGAAIVAKARGADGEEVATDLALTGVTKILVAVANVGPSTLDPEDSNIGHTNNFTLTLSVISDANADSGTVDSTPLDTGAEKTKAGGCACATNENTGLTGLSLGGLFMAAGVVAGRRRQR